MGRLRPYCSTASIHHFILYNRIDMVGKGIIEASFTWYYCNCIPKQHWSLVSQLHTIPYILLNITEIPLILSISIISLISVIPCNIDNIFEGKTQLIVTVGSLEYIWEFLLSVRGHPAYTPFLLSVIIVVL